MKTIGIWEDNGGQFTITDGAQVWVAATDAGDFEQSDDAANAWATGPWEPSEQDGWTLVTDDAPAWIAENDAMDHDRAVLVGQFVRK